MLLKYVEAKVVCGDTNHGQASVPHLCGTEIKATILSALKKIKSGYE